MKIKSAHPDTLLRIIFASLLTLAMPLQALAAPPAKENLVLMPLRVTAEDSGLQGAMETALVEGLQLKYKVFSGEQVAQKARAVFLKESRNTSKKECDETRCMQDIALAFQAELIATANVAKQDGSYFLAISIQNIFDNKVEYSKSLTCENCSKVQMIGKIKELSGAPAPVVTAAPVNSQAQEQEQQLAKLSTRIQELLTPDNLTASRVGIAGEIYNDAVKISPNDTRVKAASVKIVEACFQLATTKANEKKYREADDLINRGLELAPNNRQLTALQKDVVDRQKTKVKSFGGF